MRFEEIMPIGAYYPTLKQEFDEIKKQIERVKPKPKMPSNKNPAPKRATAQKMQDIKDEVHAEETHPWTYKWYR